MWVNKELGLKHIVLPILAAVMVLGNGALILITVRYKCLRTVTNMFIGSLALSDLLVGLVVVPLVVLAEQGRLGTSPYTCLAVFCLTIAQLLVSCLTLTAIAVERFVAIMCPLRHHTLSTTRNAFLIIIFCWSYAMFVGALPLFGWNVVPDSYELTVSQTAVDVVVTATSEVTTMPSAGADCRYDTVVGASFVAFMYPGHFIPLWIILLVIYSHIYMRSRGNQFRSHYRTRSSPPSAGSLAAANVFGLPVTSRDSPRDMKSQRGIKSANSSQRQNHIRLWSLSHHQQPRQQKQQPAMQRQAAGDRCNRGSIGGGGNNEGQGLTPSTLPYMSPSGNTGVKLTTPRSSENWRALRILTVLFGYFLFSWLPVVIWYSTLYRGFTVEDVRHLDPVLPAWFYNVSIILAYGNSAVNPYLYGFGSRSVRRCLTLTLNRMVSACLLRSRQSTTAVPFESPPRRYNPAAVPAAASRSLSAAAAGTNDGPQAVGQSVAAAAAAVSIADRRSAIASSNGSNGMIPTASTSGATCRGVSKRTGNGFCRGCSEILFMDDQRRRIMVDPRCDSCI